MYGYFGYVHPAGPYPGETVHNFSEADPGFMGFEFELWFYLLIFLVFKRSRPEAKNIN
jgi:hypothetical protein